MIALFQKDLRLYRAAFYTAAGAIVAPYLLGMIAMFYDALSYPGRGIGGVFEFASMFGLIAAIVVAAIFGGFAFSIERRDCSADFLAMLPVSRLSILLSKCLLPLGPLIVLWLIHSSAFFLVTVYERVTPEFPQSNPDFIFSYAIPSAAMILVFGIAWLAGIFIKSPSIAASIALAILMASGFLVGLLFDDPDSKIRPPDAFFLWAMTTGIVCFLIGAIVYCKRVSP